MTKKCLLRGYFAQNFGDDLIIRTLCERYPSSEFYAAVTSSDIVPDIKNLHPVNINSAANRLRRVSGRIRGIHDAAEISLLSHMDAQMYIGGSIFQQNRWWRQNFEDFSRRLTVPTYISGASFGPVRDKEICEMYRPEFEKCADVAFRDRYSYDIFSDTGTVRLCGDTAEYYGHYPDMPKKQNTVLISVISADNPSSEYDMSGYEKGMAKWSRELASSGYKVTIAAFCRGEGDCEAARHIGEMSGTNPKIIYYNGDTDGMLEEIGASEYVIATRFHAVLAALRMSCRVLPVIYHTKQKQYFDISSAVTADNVGNGDISGILKALPEPNTYDCKNTGSLFNKLDLLLK